MPTLLITKKPNDFFSFVLDGDYASEIKNIRNDLLTVGNYGHFKTSNGANLIKFQNITPSDVTIVDDTTTLNPTTTDDLFDALRSVGYFDWIFNSGTGGVDRFVDLLDTFGFFGQDGKTIVVDESQMKLIPVTFYNVEKFTQLSDVPNAHVAGKWLMSDGTKLIFVDLPPAPTDPNALPSGGYPGTGADLNTAINNLQDQIDDIPIFNGLTEQLDFEANGTDNFIDIGTILKVTSFYYGSVLQEKKYWEQSGSIITFTFTPDAATPGTSNLQFT